MPNDKKSAAGACAGPIWIELLDRIIARATALYGTNDESANGCLDREDEGTKGQWLRCCPKETRNFLHPGSVGSVTR